MATDSPTGGPLVEWYRRRIGVPATDGEARGYWIFAFGVVLGIVGILLFLRSRPAGSLRQWSIVLASAGLVLLLAGPIIRLPLRRVATWLVYLGVVICAAAIVWFVAAFPGGWSPQTGQPAIIGLYAAGLLVMAIGGVFVPVLTSEATRDDERAAAARQRLQAEAERDETREALADAEADEADLAAGLRALRTSQAHFELYEDRGGQWRWRLRHRNGNVVADGGQGYTRRHNAQKGMHSVRRNALGATVLLVESEEELPQEGTDEGIVLPEETGSRATFELFEDDAGRFRWRLRHDNGDVLADSGQGYASRGGAETAIDRVKTHVGPADYLRLDPAAFEVFRDSAGEWRWRLVHRNGNVLGDSGEGYSNRGGARRAIDRIREGVDEMEFEIYEDRAGEHRWRLRAGNDRIMTDSGEGYASRDGAEDAVERVREYAPEAAVLDSGQAAFEVYEDGSGKVRWRLRHRNGNIVADSGQGYSDRSGAWDGIESVKRNAPAAGINPEPAE